VQSRLLPDQARALAHGGLDPRPGRDRSRATAAARRLMGGWGLVLLILVGAGILGTGLPAAFVLIAAACLGALIGVAGGAIPLALLEVLPGRLVGLFENDLLQALPLYVIMGLLLDRLPIADALYRSSNAVLPRRPAAPL